jgi:dihydrofolate reductase
MARKIVVYIATSADGFIARRDGSADWLDRPKTAGDYGMAEFYESIDTIIWGRRTMDEAIARFGSAAKLASPKSKIKNYVISHRPGPSCPGLEFVNEPVADFAKKLRAEPGKDIWIMGGAGVIGSFLDAKEIDEFVIHVIPTFIGEGIPLIQSGSRTVNLELLEEKSWTDGVVGLHYKVLDTQPTSSRSRKKRR